MNDENKDPQIEETTQDETQREDTGISGGGIKKPPKEEEVED